MHLEAATLLPSRLAVMSVKYKEHAHSSASPISAARLAVVLSLKTICKNRRMLLDLFMEASHRNFLSVLFKPLSATLYLEVISKMPGDGIMEV